MSGRSKTAETVFAGGRLQSLHTPRRIKIGTAESGEPLTVYLYGRPVAVEAILETWRIDDEWWLDHPISRLYYRLLLEDGRTVDVYQSVRTGVWFRQAY